MFKISRKRDPFYCGTDTCSRQVSVYCVESASYLCDNCAGNHGCLPTLYTFHPVKYSHNQETLLPYCRLHDSFESFRCLDCSKFCCKYCQHRYHIGHCTRGLEQYFKTKYEENITKELKKLFTSKGRLENLQDEIKAKKALLKSKKAEFLKSAAQRKDILTAKCLFMISNIESKVRENYNKMEAKYLEELTKLSDAFTGDIAQCNDILNHDEKYRKSNPLEKYYSLNQFADKVKVCNESLNETDEILDCNMVIDQPHNKEDDLLFLSFYESFGVTLMLPDFMNDDEISKGFTYKPSNNFQKTLKDDEKIRSYIQKKFKEELIQLSTRG